MGKHDKPVEGVPIGNQDPNRRGRSGDPVIGQPGKDTGKHSGGK
jgi:hypothetical protein